MTVAVKLVLDLEVDVDVDGTIAAHRVAVICMNTLEKRLDEILDLTEFTIRIENYEVM